MAELLGEFRAAVLAAAEQAMGQMQFQMLAEAETAISDFVWEWNGPISGRRSIIDSGNLMRSVEWSDVEVQQNSITFSLSWDPVDPESGKRYGALVHDGQAGYFEGEEGGDFAKDYTARPWTFLLIPADQRDDSDINTDTGPATQSLPEDGWEAALTAFNRSLRQELSRSMKVTA
jgi:hypothetical protein